MRAAGAVITMSCVKALPSFNAKFADALSKPKPDLNTSPKCSINRLGKSRSDSKPSKRPSPGFTARMRPSPTLMSSLPLIHASENPDGAPGHVPSMRTCASLPPASKPLNPKAASVLPKSCELMSMTICDVLMRVLPFQLPCDWMVKSAPFESNLLMYMPCSVGVLSNVVVPSCALPSLRSPIWTCSGGIENGATGDVTCGGGGGPGCFDSGGSG